MKGSIDDDLMDPDQKYNKMSLLSHWKGAKDFAKAQVQVVVVLIIAYMGNNWPKSYHRNENHNETMFWAMNIALVIAGLCTLTHDKNCSNRGVQLLSRAQTEEWKGWMQWAFIMYHYYRMYSVYNEIRVFVSAYVWMTGFGNFLYFDKKKDFSLERGISMWIRINYFPLLLSFFIDVKLELYYVVPLHTAGFFVTMATCYLSHLLEKPTQWSSTKRNLVAIMVCLLVHIVFYETPAVNVLKIFGDEYHFRFQADKYSAWVGIVSGFVWFKFKEYMQWCYAVEVQAWQQTAAMWAQRFGGVGMIALWYGLFGHMKDKFTYNPVHPYVFWMPVAGWLMIRNSSKYLTELHMGAMEFFGRITLETYVLQFHVFMCNKVQHIPVIIPGADKDGTLFVKTLNMLLCGSIFVGLAFWARQITVTTQTSMTELVSLLWRGPPPPPPANEAEEGKSLVTDQAPVSSNGETKESV
mmetsp:Transcript_22787/g.47545  ORF Transcript_22787/g.47545 Transcript_22787/m.47545 type:complete len:466 (-) Transcript_22787:313-1710(-)|eukprot:CAMPEP_0172462900 /NCGR_PEP_ID=MMETSP1065-20121228/45396_1 /TAXON_ID=265537 /ORGANISM="Amphiprora paludosa, Strain CCMP125" /LENGTH=465 /DNA_ID=CAMNT_0013218699 /DNA_START=31 /DNA_END=1428 /DNA_ORIENTATION=+